jgi:RimJ/RimL family protein N-acetyltransferase
MAGMTGAGVLFETERLRVRWLRTSDAAAVAGYRSDDEVARFQSWSVPYSEADAAALIASVDGHALGTPGWAQVGIELVSSGELIGDMGVNSVGDGSVELGFTIARSQWRKGYATEAARALGGQLLGPLGLRSVVAEVAPANAASLAVLRRLGFADETTLDDGYLRLTLVAPSTVVP